MRHRIKFRKLGKSPTHRVAMLKTMVTQLIRHERIETTLEKAKELRKLADRVITYGKRGSDRAKRLVAEIVRGEEEQFKLFTELAQRYRFRDGGYTRVLRSRVRDQDAAKLAYIEFVDRTGELRPARAPRHSLLPPAAEALTEQTPSTSSEKEDKKPDPSPPRFFGLF